MSLEPVSDSSAGLPGSQARAILREVDAIQSECYSILWNLGLSLPDLSTDPSSSKKVEDARTNLEVASSSLVPKPSLPSRPTRHLKDDHAAKSVEGHRSKLDPLKLFISNMDPTTTHQELLDHFAFHELVVIDARVVYKSRDPGGTFPFVDFKDKETADFALYKTDERAIGPSSRIVIATHARDESVPPPPPPCYTINLRSIDASIPQPVLITLLSSFGVLVAGSIQSFTVSNGTNSGLFRFEQADDAVRAQRDLDRKPFGSFLLPAVMARWELDINEETSQVVLIRPSKDWDAPSGQEEASFDVDLYG